MRPTASTNTLQEFRFCTHLAVLWIGILLTSFSAQAAPQECEWPAINKECRPWTYWWWLGSAVNKEELTRHLEAYRKAEMGGMHIVPIYGAKGYEASYIPYLTPQWMEMLAHTTREGARLDLGVDMTSGTGWPFGGPWVGPEDAAAHVFIEKLEWDSSKVEIPLQCSEQPEAQLQAVMAYGREGEIIDLKSKVGENSILDWTPPPGMWRIYAVFQGWTKQQVKRAAPGAEGNVLDFFSSKKLSDYLARFDEAFKDFDAPPPRAFYNDSFEVYNANWTDRFFDEFEKRRGYDLRKELPALLLEGAPQHCARVRSDYRETVHDLLYEDFTQTWAAWCHGKGSLARSQAHGSPGNLIDLYGAADIPETEGFGRGGAEILVSKVASSASHLLGKPLTSSESCTWLGEHFQVSLAQVKPAIDQFFVAGINHIVYHGMPFSPKDVPYPGWLFYASTHFGLTNTFQRDFPELNRYISRCQSFLQGGSPTNDVLLYLPIYDLWAKEHGEKNMLQYCQVHNADDWLKTNMKPTYSAAEYMWSHGYTFDYVSDSILKDHLEGNDAGISNGLQTYKAVLVSNCEIMPTATLERLIELARQGGTILFQEGLPKDVPGLNNLERRKKRLGQLVGQIMQQADFDGNMARAKIGQGKILIGGNLPKLLEAIGIERERMADSGLEFVKRKHDFGIDYFIANRKEPAYDGWLPLSIDAKSVLTYDPLHGNKGLAQIRQQKPGETQVRLVLQPGDALVLRALKTEVDHPAWPYTTIKGVSTVLEGPWKLEFIDGGPELPASRSLQELGSWTDGGDEKSAAFSGTGSYRTRFSLPTTTADGWYLELGEVHETASIFVNNQHAGSLWCNPFHLDITPFLKKGENELEIQVTNLMANRIAAMDRVGQEWKNFFFVNIDYKPFDASGWEPMPSGLLGPVRLVPFQLE